MNQKQKDINTDFQHEEQKINCTNLIPNLPVIKLIFECFTILISRLPIRVSNLRSIPEDCTTALNLFLCRLNH
jgi:hypothetical protein